MLKKNEICEITIESLSSDGNGVGHIEGFAVFVPDSAVGDRLSVRIVKLQKSYGFGIIERIISPSPDRIESECVYSSKCGGCSFRHISYRAELSAKRGFVRDALHRIGGLDIEVSETLAGPLECRYRNKVQFPVTELDGKLAAGLYSKRSHRIVPVDDCLLQPSLLNEIALFCCSLLSRLGVSAYSEETGKGLLRHILIRQSESNGSVMVCFVINGKKLPSEEKLCEISERFPAVSTVVVNINESRTNVILGEKCRTVYGDGVLHDELCSVPVRLSPLSFFQVNSKGARVLYDKIREVAALEGNETLLDLYCGTGTIGLSLAAGCKKLIGAEVVGQAVADARENAATMGFSHCEFICADAKDAARTIKERNEIIDIAITDPPRKGCGEEVLAQLLDMKPQRIVMVSCNPATLARDLKYLAENGYSAGVAYPVDMFPRTAHVETVVLMSRVQK